MKRFLGLFISCICQAVFAQQIQTADFDKLLGSAYKETEPGCVALIARGDSVIYKKAIGKADLELNVPMQPDMVFFIGSLTKEFTAVCILQLAERGKLELSDEITKYLPAQQLSGKKITIENLLTHTSGIIDAPGSNAISDQGRREQSPAELIEEIIKQPIAFEPGTKFEYSNGGYMILGYIIEKVSGITYPAYLQKYIFTPLGMLHTYYGDSNRVIPNRAHAYLRGVKGFINFWPGRTSYAAGTILSTTQDLRRWNQALDEGKLLGREMLEKALASYKLKSGEETGYGYGFQIGDIQGSPEIEHSGLMGGYTSDALFLRREKIFVAILSNLRGPSSEMLAGNLAALAIGKPFPDKEVPLDSNLRNAYTGVYEDTAGAKRAVTLEKNNLMYQRIGGGPKFVMTAYAKDKFFFPDTSMLAEFIRGNNQAITGLIVVDRRRMTTPVNSLRRTDLHIPAN